MQLPIYVDRSRPQHLQDQIFDQLRRLVLDGQLKPGTSLPSSRALAEQLSMSRNTVLVAYDRLIAEGYVQTLPSAGTIVSARLPGGALPPRRQARQSTAGEATAPRGPVVFRGRAHLLVPDNSDLDIDFFVGRPSAESFPAQLWRRLMLPHLTTKERALTQYGDPAGLPALRRGIADHLGVARGIRAEPDQIIIVNGIQEALNVVARLFIAPGTAVAIENPCYQGAAYAFESYGATLVPVAVDRDGLQIEHLPSGPASFIYVTPSHQFPTGETLSLERRLRLLDWAGRTGAYIVEDDYDNDFRYDGPPLMALAGLDNAGLVIYLGTFSKSIGAGLRIGYLVLPPALVGHAITVKTLLNNAQSWLDQAVLADFIRGGAFARHLRRIRLAYRARRDRLLASLQHHFGDVAVTGVKGGMHVMWHLPRGMPPAKEVERVARSRGVGLHALASAVAYDHGGSPYTERGMVIGYSSVPEPQIDEGIARIASALAPSNAVGGRRRDVVDGRKPGRGRTHDSGSSGQAKPSSTRSAAARAKASARSKHGGPM